MAPLLASALALLCVLAAAPVSADVTSAIPDSGTRPTAYGSVTFPDELTAYQTGTSQSELSAEQAEATVTGPLATQIITESNAVEAIGEQLNSVEEEVEDAQDALDSADSRLTAAEQAEADLQDKASSAASEAYKNAVALGPGLESLASDLRSLSIISPALEDQPSERAYTSRLAAAQEETEDALTSYQTASEILESALAKRDSLKATYDERSAALAELIATNAAEMALIDAAREAYEQSLTTAALGVVNVDGMTANPKALQALAYAFAQLGDAYVWGAEGPDQFDCSGLVWASYRSVGATLSRVASAQYRSGPTTNASKYALGDLLVPGDLLFFATDKYDWTTIHHVGIYIGSGKMIHAPHTGDVVKISTVTWSEFYGAVRIFDAVPATAESATATSSPTSAAISPTPVIPSATSPSASTTPSATPSVSPTPVSPSMSSSIPSSSGTSAPESTSVSSGSSS